jgi:SAM-dependent methyltransferase
MSTEGVTASSELERFERLYADSEDPWGYLTSSYEREKYERTLAALPARELGSALEVGCSIGVFTQLLATRCASVLAIDFSARAIALAGQRLAGVENVELRQAAFPDEVAAGDWELIVCSELLYYLDSATLTRAVGWLSEKLRHGACVIAVSWRGVGRDEPFGGDQVHDRLAVELVEWHTLDGRSEQYRLDRFEGR